MAPFVTWRGAVVVVATVLAAGVVGPATSSAAASGTHAVADPSPQASVTTPASPTEEELLEARAAAAAAAREVADLRAKVELAGARLLVLQQEVATAVAAEEQSRQELADADEGLRRATAQLVAARAVRADAERRLSSTAAGMYMQGGALQDLATLLLSPPDVMSDLGVVLEHQAIDARETVAAATSAAADADAQGRRLTTAREGRAAALRAVTSTRADAQARATLAGAEAATLGAQQEALSARLAELEEGAADLAEQREAAARLAQTELLGVQAAGGPDSAPGVARGLAAAMLASYGWDKAEFACLDELWHGESGWTWSASNPASGAYGIPQALPGWKMSTAGSDWLTNPTTQIRWGLDYIASRYGSPCEAHARWLARSPHWY